MKTVVSSQNYGEISYSESMWTGSKEIKIGGQKLTKLSRNNFSYTTPDGQTVPVTVTGSFLYGCKLNIGGETITVYDKIKWYEIIFLIVIIAVPLIWGNVPALVAIFPVVGGAIGALISVLLAFAGLIGMRSTNNIGAKIGIFIGVFIANVVILYGIAMLILMIAASVA